MRPSTRERSLSRNSPARYPSRTRSCLTPGRMRSWRPPLKTCSRVPSPRRSKNGLRKIEMTCRLAVEMNMNYAWVDTCCINESSSAELSGAINSMFAWCRDATVYFVFLFDLEADETTISNARSAFERCWWFTWGWTLQELIAPLNLSGSRRLRLKLSPESTRLSNWTQTRSSRCVCRGRRRAVPRASRTSRSVPKRYSMKVAILYPHINRLATDDRERPQPVTSSLLFTSYVTLTGTDSASPGRRLFLHWSVPSLPPSVVTCSPRRLSATFLRWWQGISPDDNFYSRH